MTREELRKRCPWTKKKVFPVAQAIQEEEKPSLPDDPDLLFDEDQSGQVEVEKEDWLFEEAPDKGGVEAIFGKWPGDETDEQIEQAMKELS
jgi:hypothetical protein